MTVHNEQSSSTTDIAQKANSRHTSNVRRDDIRIPIEDEVASQTNRTTEIAESENGSESLDETESVSSRGDSALEDDNEITGVRVFLLFLSFKPRRRRETCVHRLTA